MMRKSKYFAAIAVMGSLALASCGSKDGSAGEEGGKTASAEGSAPSDWNATDACSIVTNAELAEVLKTEVSESSIALVNQASGPNAATSECTYMLKDGSRASVMTRWSPINDNTPAAIATAKSAVAETMKAFSSSKKVEDVPGLGKAAFFVGGINQLNVFIDDSRMVMITIASAPDATAKDMAIALAKKAGA